MVARPPRTVYQLCWSTENYFSAFCILQAHGSFKMFIVTWKWLLDNVAQCTSSDDIWWITLLHLYLMGKMKWLLPLEFGCKSMSHILLAMMIATEAALKYFCHFHLVASPWNTVWKVEKYPSLYSNWNKWMRALWTLTLGNTRTTPLLAMMMSDED